MTPSNFNWFLHSMLFYHTRLVIKNQIKKTEGIEENKDEEEDDQDISDNID
jgi:hypothetical protein